MDRVDEWINNYVFQNKYKEYFSEDLYKLKNLINDSIPQEKFKTLNYNIVGIFNNKERVISFPNIFTYTYSVKKISSAVNQNFGRLNNSQYNTMKIDFENRKFQSNSFSKSLEKKLTLLLNKYDFMYKIDISQFYNRIYTHVFTKLEGDRANGTIDKYIRLYNNSKTNSLLLGNVLSTLAANEIMDDMCIKIKRVLEINDIDDYKIEYFSDQFYIYYNEKVHSKKILNIVKEIIGKSYFEFEVNEQDSVIYNHEKLTLLREFKREQDSLYEIQKIERRDERFFKYCDSDYSNDKLNHFFNLLIETYYKLPLNKRKTFIEVILKRVFSSEINLLRLEILLDTVTPDENKSKRCIEILLMLLKKHPELIVTYINIGIWYIIAKSKIYINNKLFYQYSNTFYKLLNQNKQYLDSIYYFHIYYLLKNKFQNLQDKKVILNDYKQNIKGNNYLLDAIIEATLKPEIKRQEVLAMEFDKEDWLYQYTRYLNSRYYQKKNDEISKVAFLSKKSNIKIVKSLEEIMCSPEKINKVRACRQVFEEQRKQNECNN